MKYWENAAAGCLTFMEITKLNNGKEVGFIDGKSSIFINERNYKKKFEEYLTDLDNPMWEQIAFEGRKYAIENFSNDTAPTHPVTGQIWYDTTLQTIKVYNKATTVWKVMSSLTVGGVAPGSPMSGDLWWDNVNFQLSGYNRSEEHTSELQSH